MNDKFSRAWHHITTAGVTYVVPAGTRSPARTK